jgi:hypothetical protein
MAQRRSRSCAAPRPLRRHGRRSDASAQPQQQQQQHYYELPIPLVSHPRSKFRGAFTKPSPSVDSAQSGSNGGGREGGREGGVAQRKSTYFRDRATLHECLPPQHSPTLRPPISRIERPPTPRLSSSLDSRTTRARGIPFAALASVPSGFVLVRVRAVWIHRIAHCALPHSTPSTPTPTTGPRAVSSAIPQVRVALSSREKFKS